MSEVSPATTSKTDKRWLIFALGTVVLWGVWGAFTGISAQRGFPETLVYCVWALTMILPAVFVLAKAGWKLDRDWRSIFYGLAIGLLGAGGQMILFYAVTTGPAYLIFPVISLSPLVTILMSFVFLRERTTWLGVLGVVLALVALPMFDFSLEAGFSSLTSGGSWFPLALIIMACWGIQAYFMKLANNSMSAESIFFYMMIGGLLLVPAAWMMTDFSRPVNWGLDGPWLAAGIQILNAIGALSLVYAFRYGKAIVVAPMTNAGGPLVTAAISLLVANVVPGELKIAGLILAFIASALLALAA
ncbi:MULTISPECIES: DMT family transporter [Asticcacaulis]|uniref:DMT family transporter n=1 Tax=Asticcacaulis TaxID=76890 RepID=UPI001AE36606|nr:MULTISPECIES: DMT family transporter [Asticcacaulis]MBP2161613.1 drug/metabolite transporter (DMT)-like permease [Asticcacaulis solisilvae]MDR6802658.1 drug/metabolite transporter (DMT)-like permease [Asticcacaulis sp. BE141]